MVHGDQSVTSSLAEIAEATAHDAVLQSIVNHISEGWTNNKGNSTLLEHQGRTVGQWWNCL